MSEPVFEPPKDPTCNSSATKDVSTRTKDTKKSSTSQAVNESDLVSNASSNTKKHSKIKKPNSAKGLRKKKEDAPPRCDSAGDNVSPRPILRKPTLGNCEEDDNRDLLKSPYLKCLLEILQMDGTNKFEIRTQNEIMNAFQMLTGMDCATYIRLTREQSVLPDEIVQYYCKRTKSDTDTSTASRPIKKKSTAKKQTEGTITQTTEANDPDEGSTNPPEEKPQLANKGTTKKRTKVKKYKEKTNEPAEPKSTSEVLPENDAADGRSSVGIIDTRPKNWPEEVRNYYDWKSHCIVRRYSDNAFKLKEKLKLLQKDFVNLPGEMITVPLPPGVVNFTDPTKGFKSSSDFSPAKSNPTSKKRKSRKRVQSVPSPPILIESETEGPPLYTSAWVNKEIEKSKTPKKEVTKSLIPRPNKMSGKSDRKAKTGIACETKLPQSPIHYPHKYTTDSNKKPASPKLELSGGLKRSAMYVPLDEEETAQNKSKLKSKFTMRSDNVEDMKFVF